MSDNFKGNLFVGAGVIAKGTLSAPGLIEIDGNVSGIVTAQSINVSSNGTLAGNSTADHIRVAGQLLETSTARQSLLIESTGQVEGNVAYGDLEIRKGGNVQGSILSVVAEQ